MYKLIITTRKFVKVKDEYDYVEVSNEFEFDWETLVAFLGCIVENSIKSDYKFEIKKVEEA